MSSDSAGFSAREVSAGILGEDEEELEFEEEFECEYCLSFPTKRLVRLADDWDDKTGGEETGGIGNSGTGNELGKGETGSRGVATSDDAVGVAIVED